MARTVTVRNASEERVLVGDRYLLPGEQRQVPQSHYQFAGARKKLELIDEISTEAPELAAAESEVETEPDTKATSNRRSRKK